MCIADAGPNTCHMQENKHTLTFWKCSNTKYHPLGFKCLLHKCSGADPEKWMGRWLKWRTKAVQQNFWLINYSLWHVNCFVSIHMLLQLSVFYHHHEENEASYAVWLFCSKYVLSEWLICISLYTLFTKMVCSSKSERAQTKNIMETAHPRGVASHPIHPPWISPWCYTHY